MEAVVLTNKKDGVYTITMNRPETMNVLCSTMIAELNHAFENAQKDKDVKVIILQGAGGNYMAGGDIAYFKSKVGDGSIKDEVTMNQIVGSAQHIITLIQQIDKPVISLVRGVAAGFGLSLVLASDFAIASKESIFTTAYAGIGLSPDGGASFVLPRVLGLKKAKELLMLCDRFGADEALSLGILNYVVEADEVEALVQKLSKTLCSSASVAIKNIKHLVNTSIETNLAEQLNKEKNAFLDCAQTEDFATGVSAFLSRKPPKFIGK
ncbi:enoyl-CoA hydratase-related protein [Francisellaceae bacterium]|nr:enoyl-CoA hydratase-related protein [Francisellaceae bacterium]